MKRYLILLIFLPIYLSGQESEPQTGWEYFPSESQAFLVIEELLIDNQPVAGIEITNGCDPTNSHVLKKRRGGTIY